MLIFRFARQRHEMTDNQRMFAEFVGIGRWRIGHNYGVIKDGVPVCIIHTEPRWKRQWGIINLLGTIVGQYPDRAAAENALDAVVPSLVTADKARDFSANEELDRQVRMVKVNAELCVAEERRYQGQLNTIATVEKLLSREGLTEEEKSYLSRCLETEHDRRWSLRKGHKFFDKPTEMPIPVEWCREATNEFAVRACLPLEVKNWIDDNIRGKSNIVRRTVDGKQAFAMQFDDETEAMNCIMRWL